MSTEEDIKSIEIRAQDVVTIGGATYRVQAQPGAPAQLVPFSETPEERVIRFKRGLLQAMDRFADRIKNPTYAEVRAFVDGYWLP